MELFGGRKTTPMWFLFDSYTYLEGGRRMEDTGANRTSLWSILVSSGMKWQQIGLESQCLDDPKGIGKLFLSKWLWLLCGQQIVWSTCEKTSLEVLSQ